MRAKCLFFRLRRIVDARNVSDLVDVVRIESLGILTEMEEALVDGRLGQRVEVTIVLPDAVHLEGVVGNRNARGATSRYGRTPGSPSPQAGVARGIPERRLPYPKGIAKSILVGARREGCFADCLSRSGNAASAAGRPMEARSVSPASRGWESGDSAPTRSKAAATRAIVCTICDCRAYTSFIYWVLGDERLRPLCSPSIHGVLERVTGPV